MENEINKIFEELFKYKENQTVYCKDYTGDKYKTYKVIIVNKQIIKKSNSIILVYGCVNSNDIYIEFNESDLYIKD